MARLTLALPASAYASTAVTSVSATTVRPGDTLDIALTGTSEVDFVAETSIVVAADSALGALPAFTTLVSCTDPAMRPCTNEGTYYNAPLTAADELVFTGATAGRTLSLRINDDAPAGTFTLVTVYSQFMGGSALDAPVTGPTITIVRDTPQADVAVAVHGSDALLFKQFIVTATTTNNGPATATGVVTTTQLPAHTSHVTGLPANCAFDDPANKVTCTQASLAPGQRVSVPFTAYLALLTLGHFTITTTRTASSPLDPNPANDTASIQCTAVTTLLVHC
ncbi:hypothetical protein [Streptomyces sp. NPDC058401]|uniref:hypothetical protein n=1 Tax=Streptomyces sp. NPDC058401 TaxID=3346480 RepID=UPI003658DA7F